MNDTTPPTTTRAARRGPISHGSLLLGAIALLVFAPGCAHQQTDASLPTGGEEASRTTAQERGTFEGGPDWFTGQTSVSMLFSPNGPRDFGGASVTFDPGSRTAWHSHPAGQTLVVTDGVGWVQLEGGERLEVRPGDVVWTPPGVRHWHGATPGAAMTHIALQSQYGGRTVDWFEPVTDAEYAAPQ
jgi:quercetin dioxygenase-like cupin family protein